MSDGNKVFFFVRILKKTIISVQVLCVQVLCVQVLCVQVLSVQVRCVRVVQVRRKLLSVHVHFHRPSGSCQECPGSRKASECPCTPPPWLVLGVSRFVQSQ